MLAYLRRHHIGLLALFVALGGTSYAAAKLPRNSVGTPQLRSGAVTQAKLAPAVRDQLTKPTVLASPGVAGAEGTPGCAGRDRRHWRDPVSRARRATPEHREPRATRADRRRRRPASARQTVTSGAQISASLLPATVTTTSAGKVLVLVTGTFGVTCTSAVGDISATVDGVSVPGVLGTVSVAGAGTATRTLSAVGVAVGVPAGQHTRPGRRPQHTGELGQRHRRRRRSARHSRGARRLSAGRRAILTRRMLTDYHVHLRPDDPGTTAANYFTGANADRTGRPPPSAA